MRETANLNVEDGWVVCVCVWLCMWRGRDVLQDEVSVTCLFHATKSREEGPELRQEDLRV